MLLAWFFSVTGRFVHVESSTYIPIHPSYRCEWWDRCLECKSSKYLTHYNWCTEATAEMWNLLMIFHLWSGRYLRVQEKHGQIVLVSRYHWTHVEQTRKISASTQTQFCCVHLTHWGTFCQGCPAGYFKDGEGDLDWISVLETWIFPMRFKVYLSGDNWMYPGPSVPLWEIPI